MEGWVGWVITLLKRRVIVGYRLRPDETVGFQTTLKLSIGDGGRAQMSRYRSGGCPGADVCGGGANVLDSSSAYRVQICLCISRSGNRCVRHPPTQRVIDKIRKRHCVAPLYLYLAWLDYCADKVFAHLRSNALYLSWCMLIGANAKVERSPQGTWQP